MSYPAGGGPVETVELTIALPPELHAEIVEYSDRWRADPSWAMRRAVRYLLDEEDRQAETLAKLKRRPPGRPRRAA